MSNRKLVRRTDARMIAGVAAGLGEYLEVDPTVVRLILVGLVFFGGAGLWLYLIMWVLVPTPEHVATQPKDVARANVDDMVGQARRAAESFRNTVRGDRSGL